MKVLLLQLDGKLPNIALMRVAASHREQGHDVTFRRAQSLKSVEPHLGDDHDRVYASAIFTRTLPVAKRLKELRPDAIIGGTGVSTTATLEDIGVKTQQKDYSLYPKFPHSIGFTQRGCRLRCKFCVVPEKEPILAIDQTIYEVWRGDPHPRNLLLLDNDFFGIDGWRDRVREIRDGHFKVCFSQGINARMLTDETAEALASVRYYDDDFKDRRIYTAWDNLKDEQRLFAGLKSLVKYGVKPDHIMVYILVGYWPGEEHADREIRRRKLQDFGCRPYPMPYIKTSELIAYQRWVVRRIALKTSWEEFTQAKFRPENLGRHPATFPLLEAAMGGEV